MERNSQLVSTPLLYIIVIIMIPNITLCFNNSTNLKSQSLRQLPGYKCVSEYAPGKLACDDGNCDFTDPKHKFVFACKTDCIHQHGANWGRCAYNGICLCGRPRPTLIKNPLQCLDSKHPEVFGKICTADCQCDHNRVGGTCNWRTKACECGPHNPKPELVCPFKNAQEILTTLFEAYSSIGIDLKSMLTSKHKSVSVDSYVIPTRNQSNYSFT